MAYTPHVALLATGDEIKNGDILNTNSKTIAERLFNQGILPGTHMSVGDSVHEIKTAIQFLLQSHQVVIITGGLGPTSDDLTRYALAEALHKKLIFDEPTWENIVERLKNFGYTTPPDSNKQQAQFPEGTTIIANPNGTAAGCSAEVDKQWIFMLPGPPPECLPMFDDVVLPILIKYGFQKTFYHRKWLLFGVSEGEIAETLDAIAKPYDCTTGYRICYPYIEFKIYSDHKNHFLSLTSKINDTVTNYIQDDGTLSASDKLKQLLPTLSFNITICDHATGGLLESTLLTPETYHKLSFTSDIKKANVKITGLKEFWCHEKSNTTTIEIMIQDQSYSKKIPLRGMRAKLYAVEWICKFLVNHAMNL